MKSENEIILRKLKDKDLKKVVEWLNNSEINKYLYSRYKTPITLKQEIKWFNEVKHDHTQQIFALLTSKKEHIGICSLNKIDYIKKIAIFSVVIGNKNFRGKGLGYRIYNKILSYAFNILDLKKIYGCVDKRNIKSIKILKKIGFKEIDDNENICQEKMNLICISNSKWRDNNKKD